MVSDDVYIAIQASLGMVPCTESNFPMEDYSIAEEFRINECYCISNTQLFLQNTSRIKNSIASFIQLSSCFSGSCVDDSTKYNYLYLKTAKIMALNQYYDPSTPDAPVKEYLDV